MAFRDTIYERGDEMLRHLGTFWSQIFGDRNVLKSYYTAYMLEAGQTYLNMLEAVATASRLDIPVFHRENWKYLPILESDITTDIPTYGAGYEYGGEVRYGIRVRADSYSATLPSDIVGAKMIFNKIVDPEISYTAGVDYTINDGKLYLRENPFEREGLEITNVVDAQGEVIDRTAGLWLYMADIDLEYVWTHWGYALGVWMESSEWYKDFVNSVFDSYVETPSLRAIQGVVAAVTGIPFASTDGEVVEAVITRSDTGAKQVVTDKEVYEFPADVAITVSVGDTVNGGDPLCDAVEIIECLSGVPTYDQIPALALGRGFLAGDYLGSLFFVNTDQELIYTEAGDDGRVRAELTIGGFPTDVEAFWDTVHANGVEGGKTLAEYLDTREAGHGQPLPSHLPAQINPFEFVIENLLGANTFFIRMKINSLPDDSPGLEFLRYLRKAMNPHIAYIVHVELEADTEYIDFTSPSLLAETPDTFDGYGLSESIGPSFVSEHVKATSVRTC